MKGTIVQLTDKGFGWVLGLDGVKRFFHHSAVQGCHFDSLETGLAVRFEEGDATKGPRCEAVEVDEVG